MIRKDRPTKAGGKPRLLLNNLNREEEDQQAEAEEAHLEDEARRLPAAQDPPGQEPAGQHGAGAGDYWVKIRKIHAF